MQTLHPMMKSRQDVRGARRSALACALLYLTQTVPAHAALGASEDSITVEVTRLRARSHRIQQMAANYHVHELTTDTGTQIREFVGDDGRVFAVSWRGPFLPDLTALLGQYYSTFRDGQTSGGRTALHAHLSISQQGVVMHSEGRLRAFVGQAYVPALLPPGVTAGALH